jgi:hypothetical protein
MKRTTRAHLTIGTVAVLLSFTAACGGDDDGGSSGDGISASEMAELFMEAGAPEDEAQCVGEALDGEVTRDEIDQFLGSEDGTDLTEELLTKIGNALGECTA